MKANKPVVTLYPNIIPVKGFNRSLLMDLQNGKPYLVPNDLVDYVEQPAHPRFEAYDRFILENELGILADPELRDSLKPLPLEHYPATKISSAILELDEHSSWNLASVLSSLDALGTQFLEVRFLDYPSLTSCFHLLREHTNDSTIEFIQVLVPFDPELKHFLDETLEERFLRLSKILVYRAPSGFELNDHFYDLVFTKQESVSHEYCGNSSPEYFTINLPSYVRNRHFNSCLAHKISIDRNGYICNCPSMSRKYAHADSVTLSEIIALDEFRETWKYTKDRVWICSDCEFRWMCPDCRVFIQDEANPLSKPSKCRYNPYISKWETETGYLPEHESGVSVQDNRLHIDTEKLHRLNTELWD